MVKSTRNFKHANRLLIGNFSSWKHMIRQEVIHENLKRYHWTLFEISCRQVQMQRQPGAVPETMSPLVEGRHIIQGQLP